MKKIVVILFLLVSSLANANDGTFVLKTASSLAIGSVIAFSGATCPTGTILANGSSQSAATYPKLAAVYGVSSGTFALPDYRGYFLRGLDSSGSVDPDRGGAAVGSIQSDQLKSHAHTVDDYTYSEFNNWGWFGSNHTDSDNKPVSPYYHAMNYTGGNETRPKNKAVIYCIGVD